MIKARDMDPQTRVRESSAREKLWEEKGGGDSAEEAEGGGGSSGTCGGAAGAVQAEVTVDVDLSRSGGQRWRRRGGEGVVWIESPSESTVDDVLLDLR